MPGLVPGTHVFVARFSPWFKTWMTGPSPVTGVFLMLVAAPTPQSADRGDSIRSNTALANSQCRQALALAAVIIEIARIEPAFERGFGPRPFAVGDRKPGGVAIAALDDFGLAE